MSEIREVIKVQGMDDYIVDGTPTAISDKALQKYLGDGGIVIEEFVDVETMPEEIDPIELKRSIIMEKAQLGLFRRGQLSLLQETALGAGLGSQVTAILANAGPAIEHWKNDGDLVALNNALSELTDPVIRGTLDYDYHGRTIQSIIIAHLTS